MIWLLSAGSIAGAIAAVIAALALSVLGFLAAVFLVTAALLGKWL